MIKEASQNIKGNARPCVFMEPLYTIPFTMYNGYMSLYMLAMGMSKSQVGMVTSLGLVINIFFAFFSAYITDKIGRKNASLIFDAIGWGIPLVIWAFAQNIYYFIVAVVINAFGHVTMNSWQCLMLEDSHPHERIHTFNFLQIASIIGGFFAPVAGLLINKLSLVPAMRIMLWFSFVSMMALFIIRHFHVTETEIGKQKIKEMREVKIKDVFSGYFKMLKRIFKDHLLVIAVLIRAINFIQLTIRNNFLAILVTERLGFAEETMAVFYTLAAIVMLIILLFVTPVLSRITKRWPISLGICFNLLATLILLFSPPHPNYVLLIVCATLFAFGQSIATPRIDSLAANAIQNEERSVVNAMISIIMLLISTPFGYIGGLLSEKDSRLPFVLTFILISICLLLLGITSRIERKRNIVQS